jgi:hypothetical protein
MRRLTKVGLLALFYVVSVGVTVEVLFRLVHGAPVFGFTNFRRAPVIRIDLSGVAQYDPLLGWTMKDNFGKDDRFSTTEHGLRRSSKTQTGLRPGNILVSGSSFAAGSEVVDRDAWPSQLEAILRAPVDNAAVGGYALDQIILRAESLLPAAKPKVVIIADVMDPAIKWVGYSSMGRSKPYFTVGNGRLIEHNIPVPLSGSETVSYTHLKDLVGYSLVVDRVMATIDAQAWYGPSRQVVTRIQNDQVEVACLLLQKLKEKLDQQQIRAILLTGYGATEIPRLNEPHGPVASVMQCAGTMGYQIVDIFRALKETYVQDPNEFQQLFMSRTGGVLGHMSPAGNALVAKTVAAALSETTAAGSAAAYRPEDFVPGDGINLIPMSESIDSFFASTPHLRLRRLPGPVTSVRQFRLSAAGPKGEHYVPSAYLTINPGPHTLSMDVRPEGQMQVQLVDENENGVIGTFDFARGSSATVQIGSSRSIRAGIQPLNDGWYRVWIGCATPGRQLRVFLHVADRDGNADFTPDREALTIRAVQIERGQSASPYQLTSGPLSPDFLSGTGLNILPNSEVLQPSAHASVSHVSTGEGCGSEYRIAAAGAEGQHYIVVDQLASEPAPYTLSLQARREAGAQIAVQILDPDNNGATAVFDLEQQTRIVSPNGSGEKIDAEITPSETGWSDIWLATTVQTKRARIILHILDRTGNGNFTPNGEAIMVRRLWLEKGQAPSTTAVSCPR